MAESSTTSGTSSSTTSSSSSTSSQKPTQYIRESSKDDELQPDAFRGNEQMIKDLGITDEDKTKRQAAEDAAKKAQS